MSKQKPSRKKQLLLAASSILILLLLSRLVEWDKLGAAFSRARFFPIFCAFLVTLPFPLLNTTRWLAVLRAVKSPISFWRCFEITMACWPLGVLTPGKAGELLKVTVVHDRVVGFGTVFAERVVDFFMLGIFGIVFGLVIGSGWAVLGGVAGIGASVGIIVFAKVLLRLLRGKKIAVKLEGLIAVLPQLASQPRLLLACALSSGLNWWLSMVQMWFLLEAFGAPTSLWILMAIVPGATFMGLLPITLAGVGTRDAAFLFLGMGFIDEGALLASAIMYSLLGYFMLGIFGLPFLGALTRHRTGNMEKPVDTGTENLHDLATGSPPFSS